MALFGLGKFSEGFVTGLAQSVDKNIQEDMQQTRDNMSRLATLRAERAARNYERDEAKKLTRTDEIKGMVSQLSGSTDAAQYLISEYGYDRAKEIASTLKAQEESIGINPLDEIGLEQRSGQSVTVEQLIAQNAPMTKLAPVAGKGEQVAVGFMRAFMDDDEAIRRATAESDATIEAAGLVVEDGEDVLKNVPTPLQGKLRPYMLGRLADPKDEYARLVRVENNLRSQGKNAEADAVKAEAVSLGALAITKTTDKYNAASQNAATKVIDTHLAGHIGVKGNLTDAGFIIDAQTEGFNKEQFTALSGELNNLLTKYMSANNNDNTMYSEGMQVIKSAVAKNKKVVLELPSDDIGVARLKIIDEPMFKKTKSGSITSQMDPTDLGGTVNMGDDTSATGADVTQPSKADNVASLVAEYSNATEARQKQILEQLQDLGAATEAIKLAGQ